MFGEATLHDIREFPGDNLAHESTKVSPSMFSQKTRLWAALQKLFRVCVLLFISSQQHSSFEYTNLTSEVFSENALCDVGKKIYLPRIVLGLFGAAMVLMVT